MPFDVDYITWKIVDKKVAKRTAVQERIILPLRAQNYATLVPGKKSERTVFTMAKFTIPDGKCLVVELNEKNGGRHRPSDRERGFGARQYHQRTSSALTMRKYIAIIIASLALFTGQAHAQRCLPKMQGIEVRANLADGFKPGGNDGGYSLGAASPLTRRRGTNGYSEVSIS